VQLIGVTGGTAVRLGNAEPVSVEALKQAHESWFPSFMDGKPA